MSREFRSLSGATPAKVHVLRHVMPEKFLEADGVACPGFDTLGDAIGLPTSALNPEREVDRFVLSLALICNDIIDALSVAEQMTRGRSTATTPTPYEGARTGRQWWSGRVLSSIIHEALEMLKASQHLLGDPDVTATLAKLKKSRWAWDDLMSLARAGQADPRRRFFHRIRNKLGYHYADNKPLAAGYKRYFADSEMMPFNERAYISSGDDLRGVRFHFADAAAQAAAQQQLERTQDALENDVESVAAMMINGLFNFVLQFMDTRARAQMRKR